ncbi:hypothetical protein COEX109129_07240 [Corallococcus exiguus]
MREAQTGARTDAPSRARFPQNLSDSRTDSRRMKPRPHPWRKQRRTATSSARGHPIMCTSSIVPLEPVAAKPARQLAWFAPNETDAARLAECSGDPQCRPRAVTQSCVRAASPTWGWSPQNLSDSRTGSHRMKPKTLASRNGAASHDVMRARTSRWGHDQTEPPAWVRLSQDLSDSRTDFAAWARGRSRPAGARRHARANAKLGARADVPDRARLPQNLSDSRTGFRRPGPGLRPIR